MEKIILGLLMIRRLTVYEIREIIKENFRDVYSDSLGSIQAAIKKLISAGAITCTEYVERSVNKKRYSITEKGRGEFIVWVNTPADVTETKTTELGKLFFMGLVPEENRIPLFDEIIDMLEKKLAFLLEVQSGVQLEKGKKQALEYLKNDPEYYQGILSAAQNKDIGKNINDIGRFELLTLEYGIDLTKFQIEWFKKTRAKIKTNRRRNK